MTKKRLILLILIIVAVWYFWGKDRAVNGPQDEAQPDQVTAGQEVQADEEAEASAEARLNLSSADGNLGGDKARVHYFTKEALASCAVETVAVQQAVDPKYGHRAAGALVAMTLPLPADQAEQYGSAFAPGTRLLTMQIDKEGVATAAYNDALDADGAPCVKAERRAQIERTLREFSEIKKVVITVDGKAWE